MQEYDKFKFNFEPPLELSLGNELHSLFNMIFGNIFYYSILVYLRYQVMCSKA
jgi:hypothetical protein